MTDAPWSGDACSLVDAFRSGERSPREEMEATLAAIDASDLNCFSHLDATEHLLEAADAADVSLPFGGVPVGVKELDSVAGWPDTGASLVFQDRVAHETGTAVERLRADGGAVLVGLTTASEFGGLNVSVTKLNGVTHNPWQHGRTVGGSSGGSAAAVSGGLVTLCTAADGGGSIRIPAGYTGLFGMKGTYGRIPRGPSAYSRPNTEVFGCLARSVRDTARHYDVAAGFDANDPWSLPSPGGWEAGLGTHELAGLRVAVLPSLGGVHLEEGVDAMIDQRADELIAACGMQRVEVSLDLPNLTIEWMMGNVTTLVAELGDRWPGCAGQLTEAIEDGLRLSRSFYNLTTAAVAEKKRLELTNHMAHLFRDVDLVIAATNPGPAFPADHVLSSPPPPAIDKVMSSPVTRTGLRAALASLRMATGVAPSLPGKLFDQTQKRLPDLLDMGALTILSNVYGNPACSIPAGLLDGLPVGMQVLGRHHEDALLFDVGLAAERELGWPMTAPTPSS
jgi:aspartyl-tRNA(Asn)/glutamyl-tRNA(Gln) amidotransferase subunit A